MERHAMSTIAETVSDSDLRRILTGAKVIAVVGHSDNPNRTSYRIARFLRNAGYTVYPVNPTVEIIDGEPSYPSLTDVPEPVDIVNVFRRSEYLEGVVEDAIEVGAKAVWAQLGVINPDAADKAHLDIVMDKCIKVEYARLMD
jgi:hypothetical protein